MYELHVGIFNKLKHKTYFSCKFKSKQFERITLNATYGNGF